MSDISILKIDGIDYDIKDVTARNGSSIANPTLVGNENILESIQIGDTKYKINSGGTGSAKPYTSLDRLGTYLYKVTFDDIPDVITTLDDDNVNGACSSFVEDGKLHRNFDWDYSESLSFNVVCDGFEGMAFNDNITKDNLDDTLIGQLPYRIVDGRNDYGIMVSEHILYNDWNWVGTGTIPTSRIPYLILSTIKTLDNFDTQMLDILSNLYTPASRAEKGFLHQFLVTDGTTTYVILPPMSSSGSYVVVDATQNPKLTNFRWTSDATVVRTNLQDRPIGVERWNLMPCDLSDLKFTTCYESPVWLSEFIGEGGTTKDSTDAQLTAIYNIAHALYEERERDGLTWQTMHSIVYSNKGIEELYVQEDFNRNFGNVSSNVNITVDGTTLVIG